MLDLYYFVLQTPWGWLPIAKTCRVWYLSRIVFYKVHLMVTILKEYAQYGRGREEEEEPMRFWIHIYHVSIFVQRKLEFLISLFIGCIVFCNSMPVFHEDLHAKLLFYFRSVLLSMFKLECEQTVCWTSIKKPKQNTIFFQWHSMCFFHNQLCQYGIKLHNLLLITYLNMLSKQSVKAILVP